MLREIYQSVYTDMAYEFTDRLYHIGVKDQLPVSAPKKEI